MLRIACLTATLVLCGCTCNDSDAPTPNGPGIAKRTPGSVPGARSGAAKKSGKAKAKPSGNKKKRTAAAPIGTAGDLQGVMTLTQEAGSTEGSVKTNASLELRWGTEKKVVALGNVPTPCEQQTPTPIGPESKMLTPLWTVQCQGKKGSATLVILQQDTLLQVRRSMTIEGGKASPYKLVKRIPLAEGAKIVRAETFE